MRNRPDMSAFYAGFNKSEKLDVKEEVRGKDEKVLAYDVDKDEFLYVNPEDVE